MRKLVVLPLCFGVPGLLVPVSGLVHGAPALEEVVVSGALRRSQAETALPVNVVDQQTLREQGASTLGETLKNQVGVASASFGPGVGAPVIRGQSGNRVRVLQDSLGSQDASAVSPDHANAIEPLLAERIEVLRGPATLLYGNGAIGGVVNVIDNRIAETLPGGTSGALEQRYNSASGEQASVFKVDTATGPMAWHVDGVYRDSDDIEIPGDAILHEPGEGAEEEDHAIGLITNTSAQAKSLAVGGSYILDQGFIGLSLSRLDNNYGVPPGAHEHHHDGEEGEVEENHDEEVIRIDLEQTRADIKGEARLHGPFDVARLRLGYSDYRHVELEGAETGTEFTSEGVELRTELTHKNHDNHHGVVGLQLSQRDFAVIGEEAFLADSTTDAGALFAVQDVHVADWVFELGGRAEQQQVDIATGCDRDHDTYSVSASSIWHYSPNQHAFITLNRGQRAPTVEELFSNTVAGCGEAAELVPHVATRTVEIGNTELDTEQASSVELAWRLHGEVVQVEANVFHNAFSDYIYLAETGAELDGLEVFHYAQQGASFQGLELQIGVPLDVRWLLTLQGERVDAELDDGTAVPRQPPAKGAAELRYSDEDWSAYLRHTRAAPQREVSEHETRTEGYTLVDLGGEYVWTLGGNKLVTFASLNNLLDEEIRLSTSFLKEVAPEPGRGVRAGVRYQF